MLLGKQFIISKSLQREQGQLLTLPAAFGMAAMWPISDAHSCWNVQSLEADKKFEISY